MIEITLKQLIDNAVDATLTRQVGYESIRWMYDTDIEIAIDQICNAVNRMVDAGMIPEDYLSEIDAYIRKSVDAWLDSNPIAIVRDSEDAERLLLEDVSNALYSARKRAYKLIDAQDAKDAITDINLAADRLVGSEVPPQWHAAIRFEIDDILDDIRTQAIFGGWNIR